MDRTAFSFSIKPDGNDWIWAALSCDGEGVLAHGRARTKAEAAALVVRFIARALHPGSTPPVPAAVEVRRAA
jgi:hypothetical protein